MNNMRLSTKKGTRSDLQGVPYTRHILEYSSGDARYVTATAYSQAANHILDLSYLVLLMSWSRIFPILSCLISQF